MWKKTEGIEPQAQVTPQPQTPAPSRTYTPKTQEHPTERALIGPTIFIKGEVRGEEDLLIEGRIEGKIEFKQHNITIGKSGRVMADIIGKLITIEGEVQGNLYGEEQMVLRQSSNVRGNITAPRVTLEDGCHFKGSIDMCPKESAEARTPPASEPEALLYSASRTEKTADTGRSGVAATEGERSTVHR